MTLQMFSLLDMSSDEHVSIWDYGFTDKGKNFLNPVRDWKGNRLCLIGEKAL